MVSTGGIAISPDMDPRALLGALGLKLTRPRIRVLEQLLAHARKGGHIAAEQIYVALGKDGESVSLGTIYRTLALLETHKIVTRQRFHQGATVYELVKAHTHHHMIDPANREIIEFSDPLIETRLRALASERGYRYLGSELTVYIQPHNR